MKNFRKITPKQNYDVLRKQAKHFKQRAFIATVMFAIIIPVGIFQIIATILLPLSGFKLILFAQVPVAAFIAVYSQLVCLFYIYMVENTIFLANRENEQAQNHMKEIYKTFPELVEEVQKIYNEKHK